MCRRAEKMMGSTYFEEEEEEEDEDQFFDSREEVSSASDCSSDSSGDNCNCNSPRSVNCVSNCLQYDAWTKRPESISERRRTFMEWSGLSSSLNSVKMEDSVDEFQDRKEMGVHRIRESSGAVLRNAGLEDGFSSSQPSSSSLLDEAVESVKNGGGLGKNLVCTVQNVDNPMEFLEYVMEVGQDGEIGRLREVGSDRLISLEEFERCFSSHLVQQLLRREGDESRNLADAKKKAKKNWIKKLSAAVRIPSRHGLAALKSDDPVSPVGPSPPMRRVRVNLSRKQFKEMSSLYSRQDFQAHKGSVSTMKFSLDGQYLASAGKDGVVRVWKVNEDARLDESDILDVDPSCLYFSMNQPSKLAATNVNKEKMKKFRKSRDLACAVLPPKVFRISERPMHEFHGHSGEVLDLSWSKKGYLLSSSVDKTVRMWKVGCDGCVKVFSHNNYVTCVSFNPVDGNYFISGSIDGIVRMWEVSACQVVDYIDLREIVTAVSYRPNGKEGIVGSISGNCYFVDIIENHLHLEAHLSLQGKKKTLGRRITGFQFCTSDPRKVMVTSADSLVQVLCEEDVMCKFKGPWNDGSHMFASFTSDGKHIVSASEDSNVCVWNYNNMDRAYSGAKKIRSCESFLSDNASIAIPWCGMSTTTSPRVLRAQTFGGDIRGSKIENGWKHDSYIGLDLERRKPVLSPDCFPLSRSLFSESQSLPRGSATWPEEKIPLAFPLALSSSMYSKSESKLLKGAWQSMLSSDNMWGLVIVTAGWDGRIRTYQNYGLPVRI